MGQGLFILERRSGIIVKDGQMDWGERLKQEDQMKSEREEMCKGKVHIWTAKTKSQLTLHCQSEIVEASWSTTIAEGDINGITKKTGRQPPLNICHY